MTRFGVGVFFVLAPLLVNTAAQPAFDPCAIDGVGRIVAVGDIHGAYDGFVRILRAAGVIDQRERWIGNATYLVQTGDVVDRGAQSRRAMDLLRRLERDAPKKKGRVVALIGNHETMWLGGAAAGHPPGQGFFRDINPAEIEAFRTSRSAELRDAVRAQWLTEETARAKAAGTPVDEAALVARFDAAVPLGYLEMTQAFSEKGDYGRWIRDHAAAARINGILFLHGGVSARVAPLGCAGINAGIRADLTTGFSKFVADPLTALAGVEDGPLWYRGLALSDEATHAPEVDKILEAVGARAIVIGHTVAETGRIMPRFGGRVVQIDTGMLTSVYKGGRPSALEIVGDKWTAIYEDGREPIAVAPPTRSQAQAARAGAR
jgi:Calcineurin-like phosphoesterase